MKEKVRIEARDPWIWIWGTPHSHSVVWDCHSLAHRARAVGGSYVHLGQIMNSISLIIHFNGAASNRSVPTLVDHQELFSLSHFQLWATQAFRM